MVFSYYIPKKVRRFSETNVPVFKFEVIDNHLSKILNIN